MSIDDWKIERQLCRCCHSEGTFKSLSSECSMESNAGTFSDILRNCLAIELTPVSELLTATTNSICEVCIARLQDAHSFKQQVLMCEQHFQNLYSRNCISAVQVDIKIKKEVSDSDEADFGSINDDFKDFPCIDEVQPKREAKRKKVTQQRLGVKKCQKVTKEKQPADEGGKSVKKRVAIFRLSPSDYERDGDTIKCVRCEKTFSTLDGMRTHVKYVHMKLTNIYKCTLCNKSFRYLAPFTKHKLTEHSIDDRVKCNACGKLYNTKLQLQKHKDNFHMLGVKHSCPQCDYECFSSEALYKHTFKHKSVKEFQCKYCKKAFMRKTNLCLHEKIHTGDRRKVCKECGQAFVQKASLNYHMVQPERETKRKKVTQKRVGARKRQKLNKDEPLADEECGKSVKKRIITFRLTPSDYEREGDTLKCLRCERRFNNRNGIRKHVKLVHMNISDYKCSVCNKSFNRLAPLTRHKLTEHSIDDRVKCNACDNLYNTKMQLQKHKNTFHMLGAKYSCPQCDYESFSSEALYKHKFKHKSVKEFQCKYCKKAFMRKTNLSLHEKIHTGDRRQVCKECGQAFVQKASLNYHMGKYHPGVKF